jgi:hypothetical protein
MSDAGVLLEIERMETWIQDPRSMPGPDELGAWNRALQAALASAERGPGWPALVTRAHALGARVQDCTALLGAERDQIHTVLEAQERGGRALRGYGAAAR